MKSENTRKEEIRRRAITNKRGSDAAKKGNTDHFVYKVISKGKNSHRFAHGE